MKYSKEQKLRSIHLYDVWERNDGEQFTVVYINSKSSSPFLIENFKTRRTFSCTSNIITNNFKLIYRDGKRVKQYRPVNIGDISKFCEFSDDGAKWIDFNAMCMGRKLKQICEDGFIDSNDKKWKFCRIEVLKI